ncbi:Uncharacterised protein [Escherichia coli]|uniref:Uncharacterized protein n=1 Tax=Escherichia coli TaxID=562 RepID=A0A376WRY5_ECOLX|nr:Uncharacterised protein [Escherichia coli]
MDYGEFILAGMTDVLDSDNYSGQLGPMGSFNQ